MNSRFILFPIQAITFLAAGIGTIALFNPTLDHFAKDNAWWNIPLLLLLCYIILIGSLFYLAIHTMERSNISEKKTKWFNIFSILFTLIIFLLALLFPYQGEFGKVSNRDHDALFIFYWMVVMIVLGSIQGWSLGAIFFKWKYGYTFSESFITQESGLRLSTNEQRKKAIKLSAEFALLYSIKHGQTPSDITVAKWLEYLKQLPLDELRTFQVDDNSFSRLPR